MHTTFITQVNITHAHVRIRPHAQCGSTPLWAGLCRLPDTGRLELFAIPITAILIALVARGRALLLGLGAALRGIGRRWHVLRGHATLQHGR